MQRFREFMTQEVNAAIEAAFEAGATEIVVSDSHGNGQNLLIEKLPKNILLVRAWPRPLMMMQGIDETFAGVIFIGYHTGTTNPQGVRAHTMSSARLADVRLKGVSVSEAGINAAIAGHFNVPVIMVSGDDAVVKETTTLLGDVEGAVVKWSYGFSLGKNHDARSLLPIDPREGKKGYRPDQRFQATQTCRPYSVGCAFQELPPVRSAELPFDRRAHRRAQHQIHGQGHDRSIEVSGIHHDLRALVGALIFRLQLLHDFRLRLQ